MPAVAYMLLAALFFSAMGAGAKVLGQTLPVSQIIVVRGLITMVISASVLRARGRSWRGRNHRLLWTRGLFGFGGLWCFFQSVQHLPLADASVLFYINPIFTSVAAVFFLKEPLRRADLIGLGLAFAGVVCVSRPSFLIGAPGVATSNLGIGLALAAALFSAGSYVTIRKLRDTDDPWVITLYFTFLAVPMALPGLLQDGRWPTTYEWGWLLAVGLCTQAGQILAATAIQRLPAGPAVSLGYLQVVFAFGWGLVLFDESVVPLSAFGAVLVFMGVLVISRSVRERRSRAHGPRPAPLDPTQIRTEPRPES